MALDPQVRALLEGRNYGHLASLMADGSPHSVAVWTGVEGDRVVFFTQAGSLKARNVSRDPRVALSVVDFENPYRTAQLRGRVVATREGDAAMEVVDRISQRMVGADFPMRTSTLFEIEVDRQRFTELPFTHER